MSYELELHIVMPAGSSEVKVSKVPGTSLYSIAYGTEHYGFLPSGDKVFLEPETRFLKYAQKIGHIDLRRVSSKTNLYQLKRQSKEAEHFIFKEDGNTPLIVDQYGKIIKERKAADVIKTLEKDLQEEENRGNLRFDIALAFLKGCIKNYRDVRVLFFGH